MNQQTTSSKTVHQAWKYARYLIFFLAFFLLDNQEAKASHLAGADISYTCIGNNQYMVTLRLYRDCAGIGMPTTVQIDLSSASCGLNPQSVTIPMDTVYEVSNLCPSEMINSSCGSGSGIYPGYQIWVYSGIVTFPQTCSDWIVSWNTCCRNANVAGPSGTLTTAASLYIEAMVNSYHCNSSASFSSSPIPYFCAGQCYQYNQAAYDPEGDTLIYTLTCPLEGAGICTPHIAGLSPTQPIFTNPQGSFSFDQNTGQMNFCTAVGQAQYGALVTTVYNIVNGDTIGYSQRDVFMTVLNNAGCSSPPNILEPTVISGGNYDSLSNSFFICVGQTLVFNLVIHDADGDTVSLDNATTNIDAVFGAGNWNSFFNTTPPFSPDSVQLFIQIVAGPASIGRNMLTVGTTDNVCPIPGSQVQNYIIEVLGVEVAASDTTLCPGVTEQVQLTSLTGSPGGTYSWTQTMGPSVTFSDNTIANPIINIPSSTIVGDSVVLQLAHTSAPHPITGQQCTATDDVTIYFVATSLTLEISASEMFLCPNGQDDTISLSTSIAQDINTVNGTYVWSASPSSYFANLSSGSVSNPDAILSGAPNDSVTYSVAYSYGLCTGSADIQLNWMPGSLNLTATADTICAGDTTQLMVMLTDTVVFIDPVACSTYTVAPIPFAPVVGTGTLVSLTDDALSAALPIGFSFDFYCNSYTDFRISSNGFITFDLATTASGCCSGQVLPDANLPNDLIALAWTDLNPSGSGTIEYFTTGTAPNRQLVVAFNNVPRFGGASVVTAQIILYEGTNYIDIHTDTVSLAGNTTQGIENIDGTLGLAVSGRNGTAWAANSDAYRFAPNQAFLFDPISYDWTPISTVSDPEASSINAFPLGTTTYQVAVTQGTCVLEDSIDIVINSQLAAPTLSCGVAANPTSSVLFEWGQSPGATNWEYSIDNGTTWVPVPIQDSSLLITGIVNGACANILVRGIGGAGPCAINAATYLECCTIDTSVTQNGLSLRAGASGPGITYQWVDCNNGNAPILGATGRDFTPTVTGNYAVIINDGTNSTMSPCTSVIVLDMDKLTTEMGVIFYPNPTSSVLFIEKKDNRRVNIKITDNMGRLLYSTSSKEIKTILDMTAYPSGIYFITLANDKKIITEKIVKE